MRSVTWSRIWPWLHFLFRVAATAELPARESFALGAHEFDHTLLRLHELSAATTTRHPRLRQND